MSSWYTIPWVGKDEFYFIYNSLCRLGANYTIKSSMQCYSSLDDLLESPINAWLPTFSETQKGITLRDKLVLDSDVERVHFMIERKMLFKDNIVNRNYRVLKTLIKDKKTHTFKLLVDHFEIDIYKTACVLEEIVKCNYKDPVVNEMWKKMSWYLMFKTYAQMIKNYII